jgi:hypothetical protein
VRAAALESGRGRITRGRSLAAMRSAADFWGTNLQDEEFFMPLFYESASIERYKVFRERTLFTHRALCDRATSGVANS